MANSWVKYFGSKELIVILKSVKTWLSLLTFADNMLLEDKC